MERERGEADDCSGLPDVLRHPKALLRPWAADQEVRTHHSDIGASPRLDEPRSQNAGMSGLNPVAEVPIR